MVVSKRFFPVSFSSFWLVLMITTWLAFAPTQAGGISSYIIVIGNSMEPGFHIDDLVIAHKQVDYQIGDAVVYRNMELNSFVFHRLIAEDAKLFTLKGDNNSWIDTYQPTRDEILGRFWLHIPKGGIYLQKLRNPFTVASAAGALAGFLVLGLFREKSRGRKRMAQKSTQEQLAFMKMKVQGWFMDLSKSGQPSKPVQGNFLEGSFVALGTLALISLIVGIIAFSRPATRHVEDEIPFEHVGFFSYTSPAPQGVYDSNAIQSGDPVFPRLTCIVDFSFQYTFITQGTPVVAGTHQLVATISEPVSGWRRTVPLEEVATFSGTVFGATAKLDLCHLEKLTQSMEEGTDFRPGSYTLTVSPNIQLTGDISGRRLESAFDPTLSFYYDRVRFYLLQGEADENPLNPTASGVLNEQRRVVNTVLLFGTELSVPALRWFALIGLIGSLAGIVVLGMKLQSLSERNQSEYIRVRYESLLVEVQQAGMAETSSTVDVVSVESLAKLAEKFSTMILHMESNGMHTYFVQAEGTVYRFVLPAETESAIPEKEAA